MPSTPAEAGAGTRTGWVVTGTREADRLTRLVVRETATGATTGETATGATTGWGLATPLNPTFPKDGETNGACAAEGAASASAPVTFGALALTAVVNGAADAGRAKEATMPPETASTAEALAAGFAVREIAADRDNAGLRRFGPR
jgi:hypothetical protein